MRLPSPWHVSAHERKPQFGIENKLYLIIWIFPEPSIGIMLVQVVAFVSILSQQLFLKKNAPKT